MMWGIALITISLASVCAQIAPAPAPISLYQRPINSDCVQQTRGNAINYYPNQLRISGSSTTPQNQTTVTVAKAFTVQYYDNYKVITNTLANETYVLYQCGTSAPSSNSLPLGSKMYSVPLTSMAVLETVPVAFLELLGVMDRVSAVSSYSVSSCGQALVACNKTAPSSFSSTPSQIQAVLLPTTDAIVTSSASSNAITTLSFSAAQDPGVLNRAEWIKFLGMFFNMDASATQIFNSINSSYYQTMSNVSQSQDDDDDDDLPTLAFMQYYTTSPYTAYEISIAAYKAQYTRDAGAQTLNVSQLLQIPGTILSPYDLTNQTVWFPWNSSTGGFPSKAAANAAFKDVIEDVDIVIDETYAINPTTYNISTFLANYNISASEQDDFDFLSDDSVYREDRLVSGAPSYGLDWFEGAIARPDRVLLDFASAVNPDAFKSYQRVWLRNLSTNETVNIVTNSQCTQLTSCTPPPTPLCPLVSTCTDGTLVAQQNATSTCQYAACSA